MNCNYTENREFSKKIKGRLLSILSGIMPVGASIVVDGNLSDLFSSYFVKHDQTLRTTERPRRSHILLRAHVSTLVQD